MKPSTVRLRQFRYDILLNKIGQLLFLVIVTLFASAVIIYGGAKFTLMLAAGLVGFVLLFLPPQWLLWMLIFYAFFVLGPLNSLFGLDTHWVPYLLAIGVLFQVILYQINNSKDIHKTQKSLPAYLWSFIIFSSIALFSTAFGSPNYYSVITALRSLFFFWSVYFIFISYPKFSPDFFRKLWTFFLVSGFLQLPMVIYQRLFVASTRSDNTFWDSVIGTFPGTRISGDSGGMAFFLISIAIIAVSQWLFGKLKGIHALLIIVFLLSPILFAETKISYLLIPIMGGLIFRAHIRKNPIIFIVGLICSLLLVASVFFAGKYFNQGESGFNHSFDIEKEYDAIFGYSLKTDSYDGSNMGRMTLLNFWWEKNSAVPFNLALGHGLGSNSFNGSHQKSGSEGWRYRPLNIAHTAAATLLWDTGVLGLLAYIGIHLFGAIHANKLSKNPTIPAFHRALLFASSVIIIAKTLLIPYQNSSSTTNTFFFLLLGMVGFWDKKRNCSF